MSYDIIVMGWNQINKLLEEWCDSFVGLHLARSTYDPLTTPFSKRIRQLCCFRYWGSCMTSCFWRIPCHAQFVECYNWFLLFIMFFRCKYVFISRDSHMSSAQMIMNDNPWSGISRYCTILHQIECFRLCKPPCWIHSHRQLIVMKHDG